MRVKRMVRTSLLIHDLLVYGGSAVERMVRTSQLIHELLVGGNSAVDCGGHARCYLVEAIAGVHPVMYYQARVPGVGTAVRVSQC